MWFETNSGSIYVVDEKKKEISNNKGNKYQYDTLSPVFVGTEAIFKLTDGQTLRTSRVKRVHA